jgi:acylphosphatase
MTPSPMDERGYRISGRVQGVGFRWWTRDTASRLGVSGTVRNAADGSVEIVAAGPTDALTRFEEALRAGPRGAEVETVETMDPPGPVSNDGFEIVR